MDINAMLDCAGIDIDDTRAIAVFILRYIGAKVSEDA
jgi:hypothetical protein